MPIFSARHMRNFYLGLVKPCLDRFTAFVALVFLLPLLLIIALTVFVQFGQTPFFVQDRPGFNGQIFKLFKFRTMKNKDEKEVTPIVGKILRVSSLDELPQLLNVLAGDMSIVGPRPLLVEYLPFYNQEQMTRHSVKPGVTGLAQVSGRNRLDWDSRLALDVSYAKEISFKLDLIILARTIVQLFKRRDTSFPDNEVLKFSDYVKRSE